MLKDDEESYTIGIAIISYAWRKDHHLNIITCRILRLARSCWTIGWKRCIIVKYQIPYNTVNIYYIKTNRLIILYQYIPYNTPYFSTFFF